MAIRVHTSNQPEKKFAHVEMAIGVYTSDSDQPDKKYGHVGMAIGVYTYDQPEKKYASMIVPHIDMVIINVCSSISFVRKCDQENKDFLQLFYDVMIRYY